MTRFEQEWALVPNGARWTAVVVCVLMAGLMLPLFLLPAFRSGEPTLFLMPLFALLGVALLGGYVLLVGYVFGDARRRGMNHILWTLLAVFIPNAIGIILYFILREPVSVPCPACATPARKGHAFCACCGAQVRASCPQCRRPLEPGARNCTGCGAPIAPPSTVAPGSAL